MDMLDRIFNKTASSSLKTLWSHVFVIAKILTENHHGNTRLALYTPLRLFYEQVIRKLSAFDRDVENLLIAIGKWVLRGFLKDEKEEAFIKILDVLTDFVDKLMNKEFSIILNFALQASKICIKDPSSSKWQRVELCLYAALQQIIEMSTTTTEKTFIAGKSVLKVIQVVRSSTSNKQKIALIFRELRQFVSINQTDKLTHSLLEFLSLCISLSLEGKDDTVYIEFMNATEFFLNTVGFFKSTDKKQMWPFIRKMLENCCCGKKDIHNFITCLIHGLRWLIQEYCKRNQNSKMGVVLKKVIMSKSFAKVLKQEDKMSVKDVFILCFECVVSELCTGVHRFKELGKRISKVISQYKEGNYEISMSQKILHDCEKKYKDRIWKNVIKQCAKFCDILNEEGEINTEFCSRLLDLINALLKGLGETMSNPLTKICEVCMELFGAFEEADLLNRVFMVFQKLVPREYSLFIECGEACIGVLKGEKIVVVLFNFVKTIFSTLEGSIWKSAFSEKRQQMILTRFLSLCDPQSYEKIDISQVLLDIANVVGNNGNGRIFVIVLQGMAKISKAGQDETKILSESLLTLRRLTELSSCYTKCKYDFCVTCIEHFLLLTREEISVQMIINMAMNMLEEAKRFCCKGSQDILYLSVLVRFGQYGHDVYENSDEIFVETGEMLFDILKIYKESSKSRKADFLSKISTPCLQILNQLHDLNIKTFGHVMEIIQCIFQEFGDARWKEFGKIINSCWQSFACKLQTKSFELNSIVVPVLEMLKHFSRILDISSLPAMIFMEEILELIKVADRISLAHIFTTVLATAEKLTEDPLLRKVISFVTRIVRGENLTVENIFDQIIQFSLEWLLPYEENETGIYCSLLRLCSISLNVVKLHSEDFQYSDIRNIIRELPFSPETSKLTVEILDLIVEGIGNFYEYRNNGDIEELCSKALKLTTLALQCIGCSENKTLLFFMKCASDWFDKKVDLEELSFHVVEHVSRECQWNELRIVVDMLKQIREKKSEASCRGDQCDELLELSFKTFMLYAGLDPNK